MNTIKTLLASTAALIGIATVSHAATVNIDIEVVDAGPYNGYVFDAVLDYDEGLLENSGEEWISPDTDNSLRLSVSYGDTLLTTHEDDIDYPEFPQFTFLDGILTEMNYLLRNGVNGVNLAEFGLSEVSVQTDLTKIVDPQTGAVRYYGEAQTSPIPLPAGGLLLVGALAGLGAVRRYKAA